MQAFAHDIRYAFRSLAKAPAFSALVIGILGMGIGGNVAMFGVLHAALVRPLPFEDPGRLVMVPATWNDNMNWIASAHDYVDYRNRSHSFASLSAITGMSMRHTITGGEETERLAGTWVTVDLFATLGITPQLGRSFRADEGVTGAPYVAIISDRYWHRRFGANPDAVGSTLVIDGDPHVVVGILPSGFRFLQDVDLWRPMRLGSGFASARRFHNWLIVGRLAPGATVASAQADVDAVAQQLEAEYPETNRGWGLLVMDLHEAMAGDYRASLLLLMSSVGLVLLIACGNVGGLLTARGSTRQLEMSVRVAMGASRPRLVRQLLTESVVLALAAGVLGTLMAVLGQRSILRGIPLDKLGIREASVSVSMLLFGVALSVATGLVFGALPAFRLARGSMAESLRTAGHTTAHDSGLRGALVVMQVGVSLVLLIASGLLIRSFAALRTSDPGFNPSDLVTAEIQLPRNAYDAPERRSRFFSTLLDEVRATAGVQAAGLISQLPIRDPGNNMGVYAADNPPDNPTNAPSAYRRTVKPGYFETMQIPLVAGRGIDDGDRRGAQPVIVINRSMAQLLFGDEDPIGRAVVVDIANRGSARVVGVVSDVKISGLAGAPEPTWYGSYDQNAPLTMRVAVRASTESQVVERNLRDIVRRLDPDVPVADVATMEEILGRSVSSPRALTVSVAVFAAMAVLLASMGVYGILAYSVNRRLREIGIRIALGANGANILGLVLRRGVLLVGTGVVVGIAGALGFTRLLREHLYGVGAADPVTFFVVTGLFLLIALVACLIPARRALGVDPTIPLRTE